ncbi:uncharacterized protein [Nicotiana tomentosiformis]|uniref:uncharacterized protein n=1 Tax=Nicotiana tomentosiformis TaxID=4098 RepID=UPI00388CD06E
MRYTELLSYVAFLVPTEKERVRRFIKRLSYNLRFGMAREVETETTFRQDIEISMRLERICGQEREDKEAKKLRGKGGFIVAHYGASVIMVEATPVGQFDWLSLYHAILDWHAKTVKLAMSGSPRNVSVDTSTVDLAPVVRVFPDMFPADLSGIPPDRDIDFGISLVSRTQTISIPPYRIAPVELKELKE